MNSHGINDSANLATGLSASIDCPVAHFKVKALIWPIAEPIIILLIFSLNKKLNIPTARVLYYVLFYFCFIIEYLPYHISFKLLGISHL